MLPGVEAGTRCEARGHGSEQLCSRSLGARSDGIRATQNASAREAGLPYHAEQGIHPADQQTVELVDEFLFKQFIRVRPSMLHARLVSMRGAVLRCA